jgi:hypothetical protein
MGIHTGHFACFWLDRLSDLDEIGVGELPRRKSSRAHCGALPAVFLDKFRKSFLTH